MADLALRKVSIDGLEATLVSQVTDDERRRPVWISFVGMRNTVKALVSRAKDKNRQGNENGDGNVAFFVQNGNVGGSNSFRLPDEDYKTFVRDLETPVDIQWTPKRKRPTLYEGRIVSYNALGNTPNDVECYCPVWREIMIPNVPDAFGLEPDQQWEQYLEYVSAPNAAKFKTYKAPLWTVDLYNFYMFLSARVHVPMTPLWAPWLFKQVANRTTYGAPGDAPQVLVKFIKGYVSPVILDREKEMGTTIVEHGCYRIIGEDAKELWRRTVVQNPRRFDGLTFEKVENLDETPKSDSLDEDLYDDGLDGENKLDWI